MPNIEVPGATLFYETHGKGPYLLLIGGARGEGILFHQLAASLADHFTSITYDRRGHGQSLLTGEQDYSQRLETDADDAAALIAELSPDAPAYALGTSSGAIVAMAFLLRHASRCRFVILHEPPLFDAMPNPEEMMAKQREMYDLYRAKGAIAAMHHFAPDAIMREEMQAAMAVSNPSINPYFTGNLIYWFEREFLQYPAVKIDWAGLETEKARLVIGLSELAPALTGGRGAQCVADKMAIAPLVLPGGHLGYLTHSQEFANVLIRALGHGQKSE